MNGKILRKYRNGKLRMAAVAAANLLVLVSSTNYLDGAQLSLSWNDNSDNEDGFRIERSVLGGAFEEIATVGANIATYTDDTVLDNQSYTYRVKAYNSLGDSGYSNTATGLVENGGSSGSESGTIEISFSGLLSTGHSIGQADAFQIVVTGAQSNIQSVEFFENDTFVNIERVVPYDFTFEPSSGGVNALKAVVTTDLGVYEETINVDVPLGAAPSITALSDISILEGGESGVVAFAVDDSDTNLSSLVVSIESSNTALLSSDGITIGGSGANRTFNLAPVGGSSGTSQITVSVFDGVNTTSATFELEVRAITAPTISPISDIALSPGESVSPIAFRIEDDETTADNLTVSVSSSNGDLLPTGNLTVSGSGRDRSLSFELAANQLGSTTITITVGDGTAEAIETIEVSVESAPVIVVQPVDTEAIAGDITALEVQVSAYPEPTIQWYFEGEPIVGATGSELLFSQVEKSDEGSYSVVILNELGSVTSNSVQLSVESLITIVQAPVGVTIVGEGSAVLSVEAEGPGLTYQWYRGKSGDKSNPIAGATGSTYETDTLSADANYWVEITTGGAAQGFEVFSSSTIEVNFRLPSRYYFGAVGPGNQGSFGLMVRGDNTAVLLANLEFLSTPLEIMDLTVDEQGYFEYALDGLTIFTGSVSTGSVSGVFTGTNYSFSGSQSATAGSTDPIAGLYSAVMPNTSDGEVIVIAGPDGQGYVSVGLGTSGTSGPATVNASGTLVADLGATYTLALALDESVASLNGIVLIGDKGYPVDGQREDIEPETKLFNTSIRGQAKGGSSTMIAGFVVGGSGTKKVLIRGLGPSLAGRGVSDAIVDPTVALYQLGVADAIASNDNWGAAANASEIAVSAQMVGATPLAANSADAALLLELSSGVYTAVVQNPAGGEGTALVEIFDVSEAEGEESDATLANISMRGEIGRGNDVTIAGFVVTGDSPKRLLVRAMGTELEDSGVSGALVDPTLKIYQSTAEGSVLIAENDDWQEESSLVVDLASRAGAFPFESESKSAAKVIWLDPGIYTAVAESADSTTGVVLVEVYEIR